LLRDDELLAEIDRDHRVVELGPKRRAMVDYVEKLTLTPAEVTSDDVEGLRRVGFSDRDVLDIVEVASYYAYVNRIADGLGVDVESWIDPDG